MPITQFGDLQFRLERRPIKNLRISVLPPDGAVEVAAPKNMTDTAIRMAVVGRIPWIRKQQKHYEKQAREPISEMVQGETHYLWGKAYRLDVAKRHGKHYVEAGHRWITLFVSPNTSTANKQKVLDEFYREQLAHAAMPLFEQWQQALGVEPKHWGIRRMKTKWGSCNTDAKRILLNLELAKKPHQCLDYIVLHEMLHLIERHHNHRFEMLLKQHMPDWQMRKAVLNEMPIKTQQAGS